MRLEPVISELLPAARHGFFTRLGGVSTGVFKELNCGYGSPEDRTLIQENRKRIAARIGASGDRIFSVTQTHSSKVVTICNTDSFDPDIKADALVTRLKGVSLGVLTADCAPVLFHDASHNVSGAAHAGWRGAVGGILETTVEEMCKLGADRQNIIAIVGPCISQKNYEVGQEFLEEFLTINPSNAQFFVNGQNQKYLFDLPSFVLHQLRAQEIGACEWTGGCTYGNPDQFYSYRYTQHNKLPSYGRMLSVITN